MKPKKQTDFIEVLRTYNHADIAFVRSLLDDNEVVYYINNENANFVGSLTFAEPMRVMVEREQREFVAEMLKAFEGNFSKFSIEKYL